MKTIERYIFRRAFFLFISNLAAVSAIVWISQALGRVNVISDSSGSVIAFLKIATFSMPVSVLEVTSFALVIGLAQTFAAMNSDSELAVLNAAGAGPRPVLKPALVLALIAAVSVFALDTTISPAGWRATRQVISDSRGDLLTAVIQEGGFTRLEPNLFMQVAERAAGGELRGIFVADQRDPKAELIHYARFGSVVKTDTSSILVLRDGEVHRRAPNGDVSVVRFTTYAFNMESLKADTGKGIAYLPKDRPLEFVLNPPPDDPIFKRNPGIYRTEANRRLTSWTTPIVFALMVVALAGNPVSHRTGRIPPLLTALMIALAYRWSLFALEDISKNSIVYAAGQYLLPLAAIVLAIVAVIRNSRLVGKAGGENATLEKIAGRLSGAFMAIRRRLARATNA